MKVVGLTVALADSIQIPHIAWKGHFQTARALLRLGRQEEARAAFEQAIDALNAVREHHRETGEEDTALEEPLALELWQDWLRFAADTEGAERAREMAALADWPPLPDWLETQLQTEGEGVDGRLAR